MAEILDDIPEKQPVAQVLSSSKGEEVIDEIINI